MFKESQVYGWDAEPVDERPSEFMTSAGYSVLTSDQRFEAAMRSRKTRAHVGTASLVAFIVALFALGGYALIKLLPMLMRN